MRKLTPNFLVVALAWLLLAVSAEAQTPPPLPVAFTLPAPDHALLSIDRFDRVYLADAKQNILQLDTLGKVLNRFSPTVQGRLASVEAWSMAKIMAFYDDRQRIQLLDRFLTPLGLADLRDYTDGTIRAATLASDDRLWLFDESTFRLLKIDTRLTRITHETALELTLDRRQHDIRFLREYQGRLYMVDRLSGIYVFDNLGNYQQRLPLPNLGYVGFIGDELYYLADGQLHFQHLYTLKERTVTLPESPTPYTQALVGNRFLYLLTAKGLTAYHWR
ncbi:hypothetical protein GU926_16800 [Nibribacter ruber]|uniref:6-bladed beta-propeller n=1 Tax=Nibribacter ruber TaxID=2698458 RepID=A0A6P1P3K0_9BACT|nr:hypothetical protein [Nibribacter ruber]QHL88999.1 hypothetical protein GU926_16800 [Nibribacter ruber]